MERMSFLKQPFFSVLLLVFIAISAPALDVLYRPEPLLSAQDQSLGDFNTEVSHDSHSRFFRSLTLALTDQPTNGGGDQIQTTEGAESEETRLAKKDQNPISTQINLPFQYKALFRVGSHNRTQHLLKIQPVIPFKLNEDWNLIIRTIFPAVSDQPNPMKNDDTLGMGDVNPTFFYPLPGQLN